MLNYGILAQLCGPILDRVPTYRATQQVATFHEAIDKRLGRYSIIRFAAHVISGP
jgi:hypothetical protein